MKGIPHCILTPFINLSPPVQGSILFALFCYRTQLMHIIIPFCQNSEFHTTWHTKVDSFRKALTTFF